MTDAKELFGTGASLVTEIRSRTANFTSRPDLLPRQMAAAALARATTLLDAMITPGLGSVNEIAGLLGRAIWECWIVGLYLILAPHDAMMLLAGDYKRNARNLSENWPKEGPGISLEAVDVPEERLNFEVLSKTVSDLLVKRSGETLVGTTHAILYRGESMMNAHATYAALIRYIDEGPPLKMRAAARPLGGELLGVSFSIAAVSHLAFYVYREFGLSFDALPRFADQSEPASP